MADTKKKLTDDDTLKVLTIANHKGGIAKTTLAKILTEYFVNKGVRVLGMDIDPQSNFSRRFIDMPNGLPPVHPNFDPDDPAWEDFITPPPGYWSISQFFLVGYCEPYDTDYPNLKFIPSHKTELKEFLEAVDKKNIEDAVRNHMKYMFDLEDGYYRENFDLVIIDTPPQTSSLIVSAIRASTHLLIPSRMQGDSVNAMGDTAQLWQAENRNREEGDKINLVGILPSIYNEHSALERNYYDAVKAHPSLGEKIIDPPMRHLNTYANTSESQANPRSLFMVHESSPARQEAEKYCQIIFDKVMSS